MSSRIIREKMKKNREAFLLLAIAQQQPLNHFNGKTLLAPTITKKDRDLNGIPFLSNMDHYTSVKSTLTYSFNAQKSKGFTVVENIACCKTNKKLCEKTTMYCVNITIN
jgi:hypothetical protein